MGRSGGGGRSVGGRSGGGHSSGGSRSFSGGGHHHSSSPSHHYGPHHHYHYHSGGWGWRSSRYYSSDGGCNCLGLSCCLIPVFFVLFVVFIVVVLLADAAMVSETTLDRCEQLVVCPESIRDNKIQFTASSTEAVGTLHDKIPDISTNTIRTNLTVPSKQLWYNDYVYRSFNLVPGSTLNYNIVGNYYFTFNLVKGVNNLQRFENYESFTYIKQLVSVSYATGSYKATDAGEFFIIVEATSGSVNLNTIEYFVDHTRYKTEQNAVENCTGTHTFDVDSSKVPGACVIAEVSCDYDGSGVDVKISYDAAHTTTFWVCLVIAALGGVLMVVAVVTCIVCSLRGSKGASGQTYNTVPASATAAPVYPAGNPVDTSYQQPAAYGSVPPAYASGNPSAPAYVPYDPSGQPTYGTAY